MPATIKIMQMNSMNIWRGGEESVFLLCRELMSLNVRLVLACRSASPIDQRARTAKIPVINLPLRNAVDLESAWSLANYCRENSIDIIHAHNGRDYWLASLAKAFYPNVKVVITRHILAPLKKTLLHRWLYKKIDQAVAVSQAVKHSLTVFPPGKVAVVYDGIDIQKYFAASPGVLRKELKIAADTKIVGMVGQIHASKGHLTFIQSIPEILAVHPNTVFIVVGGGDSSELQKINSEVRFLGKRSNIPEIMKDMDIFVMASRNEPFGLVTIEAMSAGIPVVGSNSGGTAEIITDGESGLLVEPDDASKLAQAVIRILTDEKLATKLKEGGINVVHKFTGNNMARNYLTIYNEIIE